MFCTSRGFDLATQRYTKQPRAPPIVIATVAAPTFASRARDIQVSYACRCSFYEIFNEKVFDLVDESNRDNPMGLAVREDTRKGVYVEGLMEEEVITRFLDVKSQFSTACRVS